jgi:DNA-binding PadR family transcriptional regulator
MVQFESCEPYARLGGVSTPRLTTTSFIVLGLVEQLEPATPYDVKRIAQLSVANFWTLPHTQLYTECERLAEVGYLEEEREDHGRRRRLFRLTASGRAALDAWRGDPEVEDAVVRDASLLKLFLGGDPAALARQQLPVHERALQTYEALSGKDGPPMAAGPRTSLRAGIALERAYVAFWSSLL